MILVIVSIVLAIVLVTLLYIKHNQKLYLSEAQALAQKEQADSFYQKLQDGFDVNILVVGYSIGAIAGASDVTHGWTGLLAADIKSTYGVTANITNVSMGGNASYAGYVRTMELELSDNLPTDYDLAIICYGQNDGLGDFSLYYETIIRAIQTKYSKCSLLAILESSQRDYTEKMTIIQSLCDYYNIPLADTIAPFNVDEDTYNSLVADSVHPNDAGQQVYYETVKAVIDEHNGEEFSDVEISPVNAAVVNFNNFLWIGTNYSGSNSSEVSGTGFTRKDDLTYTITCSELGVESITGILGIDYMYRSGENKAAVYIDGKEFWHLLLHSITIFHKDTY